MRRWDAVVVGLATLAMVLGGVMLAVGRAPDSVPAGPEQVSRTTDSGVVEIRYQDILAGIVGMEDDPSVSVTPAQARAMKDDLARLTSDLTMLAQVQIRINRQFRKEQWQYVRDHRWTDLTHLEVPIPAPFSEMPDPMKTVSYSVSILEGLAKQKGGGTPDPRHTPGMSEDVSWFHVSQSVILFHARTKDLEFTPDQARAMLPLMKQMRSIIESAYAAEGRLLKSLTPAQKDWIMKQKHRRATQEIEGRPIIEGKDQPTLAQVMAVVTQRAQE